MRALGLAFVLWVLGACNEPRVVLKPLPPLAAPTGPIVELASTELGFVAGEHLIWEVQVRGMVIGRVELSVDEHAITSVFRTSRLVSAFASAEHELVTPIGRGVAAERLEYDGKQWQAEHDVSQVHTLHTALGAIRAWAKPGAHPRFLDIAIVDERVRLTLERPRLSAELLRIDGIAKVDGDNATLSLWLDRDRRPVRIEVRAVDEQVSAELIASD